jgi:hypothetical protein
LDGQLLSGPLADDVPVYEIRIGEDTVEVKLGKSLDDMVLGSGEPVCTVACVVSSCERIMVSASMTPLGP